MSGVKHTPWEVGQHPAVHNGWIVRPILFGSNVRVLPESEGGHVVIRDERVARLIAAAPYLLEAMPDLTAVIAWLRNGCEVQHAITELEIYQRRIDAAIARARGEQDGGGR